jgi:hypothetical protein
LASKTPKNYDSDANDGEDTDFEESSREEDDGKSKPISNGGGSEEENDSAGISDSEERHPIFSERNPKRFGVIYESS